MTSGRCEICFGTQTSLPMLYTHVLKVDGGGVKSPLDSLRELRRADVGDRQPLAWQLTFSI